MFEDWKKQLSEIEKEILNLIYITWKETGDWPNSLKMAIQFRKKIDLYEMANEFDYRFLRVGYPTQKDDKAKLSIYGIALCDNSDGDITLFMKIKNYFLNRFLQNPLEDEIHSDDIGHEFNLAKKDLKRFCELIDESHKLTRGSSRDQDDNYSFRTSYDILKLENVIEIDELYKLSEGDYLPPRFGGKKKEIPAGGSLVSWDQRGAYPQEIIDTGPEVKYMHNIEFIDDYKIRTLIENDLNELETALSVRAWKSATIIAGSIAESLLYFMFKKNSIIAERNLKGWPDNVNIYDMVNLAFKHGMISKPDIPFYDILRIYRNQIHPGNSINENRPDEFVAKGLHQFVLKIINDIQEKLLDK